MINTPKTNTETEYTIWREESGVWVTEDKTFASVGVRPGNEYAAYKKAASFLGTLVLACAVVHFVFMPILPLILSAVLPDFGFDIWNGTYFGDPDVVYILGLLDKSFGFIAVILGGIIGRRLPKDVLFNKNIRSKTAFAASIPAALALGAIYIILVNATGANAPLIRFGFPIEVQNLLGFFVLPILGELAFRGVLLFLFRQYGDLAAIITVSITVAVLQFDIRLVPATIIVSAVLCYFALATENVIVPIIMHFIMNSVIGLYEQLNAVGGAEAGGSFFGSGGSAMRSPTGVLVLLAVCFAAGVFAAAYLISKQSQIIETETKRDPLKTSDKLFCVFTSVPVILSITAIVIISLL
jgi:membrane protease YdiL (CAAX protease family)